LRPSQNYWLAQVAEHETERRASVCKAVCAMEDNKAVKERVVLIDGVGDLSPSLGIDRAGVQQLFELEDREPYVPSITAARSPQTLQRYCWAVVLWKGLKRSRCRAVVERWPWSHARVQEAFGWDESFWARSHANGTTSHDDEDSRVGWSITVILFAMWLVGGHRERFQQSLVLALRGYRVCGIGKDERDTTVFRDLQYPVHDDNR